MKAYYWIIAVTICFSSSLSAMEQPADLLFSSANKEYISGNYEKSLNIYGQIRDQRGDSAELLYNMGNAYYKKGEIGKAVLYLERALWLDPGNADIEKNLNAVRNNTGLMLEEESLINNYIGKFTLNQWCIITAALLLAYGIIICLRATSPKLFQARTFRNVIVVLAILGAVSLYGTISQSMELNRAIVVSSAAEVLISPFDGADQTASLKTGRMVYVLNEHENYLSVKEDSGTAGWVRKSQIRKIIP